MKIRLLVFLLVFSAGPSASGEGTPRLHGAASQATVPAEFKTEPSQVLDGFVRVAQDKGPFSVRLYGRSFVENGRLVSSASVKAEWNAENLESCYLIWAGEVKEKTEKPPGVFLIRGKNRIKILPQKHGWSKSTAWVYTGFADITDFAREGDFVITGLKSDPIEPGSHPYSMAGWAIAAILKESQPEKDEKKVHSRIAVYLGPEVLAPGEIYEFHIPARKRERLVNLGIVGGHGIRGNAGGNLLNGVPITGGDDWVGAGGSLWDVNLHEVFASPHGETWTLGFDPILQWIFPVAVIIRANQ